MSKQREIKFRAWNTKQQKWCGYEDTGPVIDLYHSITHNCFMVDNDSYDFPEDLILCQYTGLKDKNGEEIYEGDILSHFDKKYIVKWDGYMAAFQASNPADGVDTDFFNWSHIPSLRTKGVPGVFSERDDPNCEVIGNVYEHPELLTTNP